MPSLLTNKTEKVNFSLQQLKLFSAECQSLLVAADIVSMRMKGHNYISKTKWTLPKSALLQSSYTFCPLRSFVMNIRRPRQQSEASEECSMCAIYTHKCMKLESFFKVAKIGIYIYINAKKEAQMAPLNLIFLSRTLTFTTQNRQYK